MLPLVFVGRYLSPESHVSHDVEPEIYGNRNTIGNIYGNGRILNLIISRKISRTFEINV